MSLLQVVDLVEGILNVRYMDNVKKLPWNHPTVKALEGAGFETRTVMQIWQNIALRKRQKQAQVEGSTSCQAE